MYKVIVVCIPTNTSFVVGTYSTRERAEKEAKDYEMPLTMVKIENLD